MDWSTLELVVYAGDAQKAEGLVCLPSDKVLHKISVARKDGAFSLESDPFAGKVTWKVRKYSESEK